jgi:hypothetical protein
MCCSEKKRDECKKGRVGASRMIRSGFSINCPNELHGFYTMAMLIGQSKFYFYCLERKRRIKGRYLA